ncbi:MAG: hypothetical protein KatS3mg005_3999 [Bryobacteraceae bacterium]|nr:MAG: hypothetical protein KatS3mg005_3999 [Bryobacteraceae bacterium]
MEGLAELDQLGQAGVAEPADSLEEAAGEAAALGAGLVLVQQQVAEAPLELAAGPSLRQQARK